jgi:hypothetical protein
MNRTVFARRVFFWAGVYGLLILAPHYFMESKVGRDDPPAITHAEYFYGFIGVALAWQVAFLIIARDPVRFRPLMIPGIIEKVSFGVAALALLAQGRLPQMMIAGAAVDLLLAGLFAVAYWKTPQATA